MVAALRLCEFGFVVTDLWLRLLWISVTWNYIPFEGVLCQALALEKCLKIQMQLQFFIGPNLPKRLAIHVFHVPLCIRH